MTDSYKVYPVGKIRKQDGRIWIEIAPDYRSCMLGLERFSHINVLFWFHENDTPEGRGTMRVHPRKDKKNPLTGVFATHSPLRPNLIGLTRCKILSIQDTVIEIEAMDARDNTPVIDIKCYIPHEEKGEEIRIPDWV